MINVIFASKNSGKIKEVKEILNGSNIKLLSLLGMDDSLKIIESGNTFEENARIKAVEVYNAFRIPAIGDDSGLSVDQLDGRPGVYSARYAGENASDEENNEKLLMELQNFPEPHSAKFICSAVYYDGKNFLNAYGELRGRIINSPHGENGFGYDPLFIPEGYSKTTAEIGLIEKNKISHRSIAFNKLKDLIKKSLERS